MQFNLKTSPSVLLVNIDVTPVYISENGKRYSRSMILLDILMLQV